MNKILLTSISLLLSSTINAEESPFSISLGQKTIHTEIDGYQAQGQTLAGVVASSSAIYTNISYNHTPSLSYSFEYASFSGANTAEVTYTNTSFDGTTLNEETEKFKVKMEPSLYLSIHSQYTFRVDKTVRPYIFAGLSHISADINYEYIEIQNDLTTQNESNTDSYSSTGLTYGAGVDIQIYNSFSLIFDYRIQQDIADQPADEISGSFKYRF